jgi:hypothetical protein
MLAVLHWYDSSVMYVPLTHRHVFGQIVVICRFSRTSLMMLQRGKAHAFEIEASRQNIQAA